MIKACVVRCQQPPPKGDKIAPQYCFKATCRVTDPLTYRTIGSFVGVDKLPEVSHSVYFACKMSLHQLPPGCECDPDIELTLLEVCPVECAGEIKFVKCGDEDEDLQ